MVYDKMVRKSTPGIPQIDAFSTLFAQIFALNKKMLMLEVQSQVNAHMIQVMSCDYCGHNHPLDHCPLQIESVNYIGNFNKN